MLIVCRVAAPLRGWLWPLGLLALLLPLGLLALLLPLGLQHPFFDGPFTSWVGLVTRKPMTEDWVPVLPWLGVMFWGLAAGQWLLQHGRGVLSGGVSPWLQPLATLGRWSLAFYMLHQPVLIGGLEAWRALRG